MTKGGKVKLCKIHIILLAGIFGASAQEDIKVYLQEDMASYKLAEKPDNDPLLAERFILNFDKESLRLFSNDLHPLKTLHWQYKHRLDRHSGDDVTDIGFRTFHRTLEYSAREALADSPIGQWIKEKRDLPEVIKELFIRMIANTDETELDPESVDYTESDENWWATVTKKRIAPGIEPFRMNPYAYFGFRLGNKQNPSLISLRYYPFEFLHDGEFADFGQPKLTLAYSFRPLQGLRIDLGGSFRMHDPDREIESSIRIYRSLGKNSALFIAAKPQSRDIVFAGIGLRF